MRERQMSNSPRGRPDVANRVQSWLVSAVLLVAVGVAVCGIIVVFCIYKAGQKTIENDNSAALNAIVSAERAALAASPGLSPSPEASPAPETSPTASPSPDDRPEEEPVSPGQTLEYLERLHTLQKNASSTELLMFLYGFLSSIFIGIGAYFVKTSGDNARHAEERLSELRLKLAKTETKISKFDNKADVINNYLTKYEANGLLSFVSMAYAAIFACETILSARIPAENSVEESNFERHLLQFNSFTKMVRARRSAFTDLSQQRDVIEQTIRLLSAIRITLENCKGKHPSITQEYVDRVNEEIGEILQALPA